MPLDRLSELDQTRLEFWAELKSYLERHNSSIKLREPVTKHRMNTVSNTLGRKGFTLIAFANRRDVRIGVGVYIEGQDADDYFRRLEQQRPVIERALSWDRNKQTLCWVRGDNEDEDAQARRVVLRWHGVDFFKRGEWPVQHRWLREKLEEFRNVFKPRIAGL